MLTPIAVNPLATMRLNAYLRLIAGSMVLLALFLGTTMNIYRNVAVFVALLQSAFTEEAGRG